MQSYIRILLKNYRIMENISRIKEPEGFQLNKQIKFDQ